MSDHILKTIEHAKIELRKHEEAVINTKRLINQLCAFGGLPIEYQETDPQINGPAVGAITILRNAFFGRPLATCVAEYLELKECRPVKEATLDEIVDALKQGGFDLKKVSANEDDARRGVAITLAKNPKFHRLPNNDWGLLSWYPSIRRSKEAKSNGDAVENEQEPSAMPAASTAASASEHMS